MGQPPAFLFYSRDWRNSPAVLAMSHEQRGVFIDLLAISWEEEGIPADINELRLLLRLPPKRFDRIWERVGRQWESNGNGRLINPKQEQVRAEYWGRLGEASKRGKRAAKARWDK